MLNVGRGASSNSDFEAYEITYSAADARIVIKFMTGCWVLGIEEDLPADLIRMRLDVIMSSQMLEHVRAAAFRFVEIPMSVARGRGDDYCRAQRTITGSAIAIRSERDRISVGRDAC